MVNVTTLFSRRKRTHAHEPAPVAAPEDKVNQRGATLFPPGHFYSPLLDIESLKPGDAGMAFDGEEAWEGVALRHDAQRKFYEEELASLPAIDFPDAQTEEFRYYRVNNWFPIGDATTLAGMIRKERPKRILEVGSGFSTAVMLDTIDRVDFDVELTCVEPWPKRLFELLREDDRKKVRIQESIVQETPLSDFESLEAGDILFIDSSHVAKVGSDVVHLYLRVLPRLKPGVLVHVHDIFYPESYPTAWIQDGNAWNESLFLRAFLTCNAQFQVEAFNAYAGKKFPAFADGVCSNESRNVGGSFWMRRVG